jgi:hypothetical protein
MSLAALALRLAAVEALCPTASLTSAGAFPTLAAGRVADSRIKPRDEREPETALPFLAVYCEERRGEPQGEAMATTPLEGVVTLVVELEVRIKAPKEDGSPSDGLDEEVPETDDAAEAMLDLLEAQVIRTLEVDGGEGGALFRRIRRRIVSMESVPLRDASLGLHFARRTLKLAVSMQLDDWDDVDGDGLPAPLSTVAAALPEASYGKQLIDTVRAAMVAASSPAALAAIQVGFGIGIRPATLTAAPIRATVDSDGDPDT